MKLQVFNGGKNTRLAPHLIGINEGITYSNIDIESGPLKPVKKRSSIALAIDKYAHYFIAKDEWVSSVINRDYVEYQEKLYWTEDNSIPQIYDGTNTYNLGIAQPITLPTLAIGAAGVLTGTYTYLYTYYSSATGVESGPSFLAEITVATDQVNLSNILVSADPQVTHRRIYRVGGALTEFTLVATINNSASTYVDNIADTAVDGRLLEAADYLQAKFGAQYLTEAYAMMFYAVRDKLYFTPVGKPWAWPEEFFIDLPLPITGIGIVENGIIVHTIQRTYIVTGNTPETLSKYVLSRTQGCKKHKSISEIEGTLLWLSNDGICVSAGGPPKVISRGKLGKVTVDPIVAVTLDNVYYLQHTTGSLVYDLRYGEVYNDFNLGNTYLTVGNDKIYGFFSDQYFELFQGDEFETFTYLSPVFLDGSYTERKNYKTFYLHSEGQIDITIYVNGNAINSWNLTTTDAHELDIKQEYKNGYSVQFLISGTGTVNELNYNPYGSEKN